MHRIYLERYFQILLVGILGLLFSRWRVRSLRLQRDMFGIGCILLIFPICPAIIALSVLELYFVSSRPKNSCDLDLTL